MTESSPTQPGRRIAVLGASGCGKTFVAQRLAEVLGVTYICSDAIFWGPDWTKAPREQSDRDYDLATRADAWTFDGNVGSRKKPKDQMIVDRADTLIWLDLPRWQVFFQVLRRTICRAWTKEPMWHNNSESWRLSFFSRESILLWSMQTYARRHNQYAELFADPRYSHLIRIRFTSRKQVDAWVAGLAHTALV